MTASTIAPRLGTAALVSALLWLGGPPRLEAGVNVWTTNGPGVAGAGQTVAVAPTSPTTVYTTADDGVLKSTDGGGSWTVVNTGLTSRRLLGGLAIDPQTPTTVYARTRGAGVFKTTNGGGHWTAINTGLTDLGVNAFAINPQTPTTVYAGTAFSGLFKSTDGGGTWAATGLTSVNIIALAIDPQTPAVLYAGLVGNGVVKSADGGGTWTPVNTGLDACFSRLGGCWVFDLVIDPQTPTTVYARTFGAGVFKTIDGGGNWTGVNLAGVNVLAIDQQTPTILYAGTGSGLFKSTDGAATWSVVADIVAEALAIDPQTPTTLYAGSQFGGLSKSTDGAKSWAVVMLSVYLTVLRIDPQTPTTLYVGTERQGTFKSTERQGIFKSTDGGGSWSATDLPSGSISSLVIDPVVPSTLYAGVRGLGLFKSTDGGDSWTSVEIQVEGRPVPPRFVESLAIDPSDRLTIYFGTDLGGGLFKTVDGGDNWTRTPCCPETTAALAIDPVTPSILYAGVVSSIPTGFGVFKSVDGGTSWTRMNNGLRDPSGRVSSVSALAIDPINPSTVYANAFKSTDGGGSWSPLNSPLPDLRISALAIDPETPTTLYAGTPGGGVFKSIDGGGTWSALTTRGLTNLNISLLAIDCHRPATLYAGTGHGVFALQQTTVSGAGTTTVTFDTPAPPGHPGPLAGVFEGIDFGTGQWAWEGPYDVGPTNHIYFADWTGTSRSFAFAPAPRVLDSLSVFSLTPETLTLADDAGQTLIDEVATGSMQIVTTGWTRPSTTVTVSFTNGWDLGIDDIISRTAP